VNLQLRSLRPASWTGGGVAKENGRKDREEGRGRRKEMSGLRSAPLREKFLTALMTVTI